MFELMLLSIYFLFGHLIKHYHCHELWFAYCNTCKVIFSSLKLENGLKKHVRNVTRIKCGFVELDVILFTFNTRCDYVISSDLKDGQNDILEEKETLLRTRSWSGIYAKKIFY